MDRKIRITMLVLLSSAVGFAAAAPDASGLNAKLKACAYRHAPTGDPCIDVDQRDIRIEGDRIVFRERHEYTPYSGGPACRNYTVEREEQAPLAALLADFTTDNRDKGLWLTLRCTGGSACVTLVNALRSGKPTKDPDMSRTKIVTALGCKDAVSVAAELKAMLKSSQEVSR